MRWLPDEEIQNEGWVSGFLRIAYRFLRRLHGQADYYDAAGDFWDVEGLEDDLRLAKVPGQQVTASLASSLEPDLCEREQSHRCHGVGFRVSTFPFFTTSSRHTNEASASAPAAASAAPSAPSAAAVPANQVRSGSDEDF